MMRILLITMAIALLSASAWAQQKYTLSGYLKDGTSGEELIGATVYAQETGSGTSTNVYGFYSLTLPEGTYKLTFQYIGFADSTVSVTLNKDMTLSIELAESSKQIEVVEIKAERSAKNVEEVEMSTFDLPVETIKKIPAAFGEVDVVKSLQLLPGITGAGEGVGGFYVRGGGVDQNLILLDEAPVYNASHLLGFFSVFNPDAIKDVKIYKGGIPAEYGGRLSSLLDIRMNDGNMKRFSVSGGIGLISSRLTIEGPIWKDKMSFVISGRRTYVDLFLKLHPNKDIRKNVLYFYDMNAKYNWRISEKDRLFISGYFGRDVFKFGDAFFTNWGNATATARWNHLFSDKMFSNFTFVFSDFDYSLGSSSGDFKFDWKARIRDYSVKNDNTYYLSPNNTLKFGVIATHHTFYPGKVTSQIGDADEQSIGVRNKHAIEYAAYVSDEHKFGTKWTIQYGLRWSFFNNVGPGREFEYDDNEVITDTTNYSTLTNIKMYNGAEPRLAIRYGWNPKNAVKLSYNRTRQYIHLVSNSTVSSPFDIWVPTSRYIEPMTADQVAIGYFRNFKDNMFEVSVEGYYKYMQNLLDYIDNAELLLNESLETQIRQGNGYSFGAEFLVRKQTGRLTGWISYSISRTRRTIPGINNGNEYAATYDRTHDVAVVLTYQILERLSVSTNWVFTTGLATTVPAGKFTYQGTQAPIYTDRNDFRLPAYHRLDLSLDYQFRNKKQKRYTHSINFSVYNTYYQKNTFSITFREDDDNPGQTAAYKTYLFTIIPSITYNFKF